MGYPYDPPDFPQVPQATGAILLLADELNITDFITIINAGSPAAVTTLGYFAQFLLTGGVPSGASGLTATGNSQATALLLPALINVFSTVTSGTGAGLPLGYSGPLPYETLDRGAHSLLVYPGEGDQIEGYGINQPVEVSAGGNASFSCFDPVTQAQPRTWWLT